ncbi:hypothetical protein GCM10029992_14980 [Glycomyces albus]
MTMVAKNSAGARNLFRLSSQASFEGYYYKPRMDRELISQHAEGIVATTGCPSGEVQTRMRLGQMEAAYQAASDYRDIFGKENYFLELMDHGNAIEQRVKDELYEMGRKMGLPPLVTNDSHFVTAEQKDTHAALLCVQSGSTLDDPKRFKFDGEGYFLRSADQMYDVRGDEIWQQGCENTLLVAEMVEDYDEIFAVQDRMPKIEVPEGHDQGTWLTHLVMDGLKERFSGGEVPAEYLERVKFELDVIIKTGYPPTSWSSPTSSPTPAPSASTSAPAAGRPPGPWSPTRSRSPTSTRSSTGCCSSGSSTPSASPCPTSTSTSTTGGAAR